MDKDAYPTFMPQALKILEKFKAESGAMTNGRNDTDSNAGVAFALTKNWVANVTCHHCGIKGHCVNNWFGLTDAQRKKFWEDYNAANQAKTAALEPKKSVADAAVAKEKVAPPAIASADQMNFEKFQRFMVAAKELSMEFLNVETPVNNVLNLLSDVAPRNVPGTVVNPGKHVTFAEITRCQEKCDQAVHASLVQAVLRQLCYVPFSICENAT